MTHIPTEESRRYVRNLTLVGVPQATISAMLEIEPKTLRKHYRDEIDFSVAKANSVVAGVLYDKAVNDRDTGACIFWLKTRAKWSETMVQEGEQTLNINIKTISPKQKEEKKSGRTARTKRED